MAVPPTVEAFFSTLHDQGHGEIITERPTFDLELYLNNYVGKTHNERLLHIAKTCPPLCIEALKLLVDESLKGRDVGQYTAAWDSIRIAAPDEPQALRRDDWIRQTEQENSKDTARLEAQLKQYKNNLIKDSIRLGNEELGTHYATIGKLNEAVEAFGRMRHDITTTKQIVDCGIHLIDIAIQRRDWAFALSNVNKISSYKEQDVGKQWADYVNIVPGLALMGLGNYAEAANHFVNATASETSLESNSNKIASLNDVAIYGGLLALATMSRDKLEREVLENKSFRLFLDEEPHVRKAISLFVNGRYSACLDILGAHRPYYLLDIYLHKHVKDLFFMVRRKCINQYCMSFSCVTLADLQSTFGKPGQPIEDEIVTMIASGDIQARIDAKAQTLNAVQPDPRSVMQKTTLDLASKYEQEAKERLRRINLMSQGLEVIGVRAAGNRGGLQASALTEEGRYPGDVEQWSQAAGTGMATMG